jgi:multiple sugar transport system substrate-binding protein
MKHMRINTVIVMLLAISLILAACAPQPAAVVSEGRPAGKMVVRQWEYSADPNALEISKQMVENFNAQSETIEVRLELIPRDIVRQKLLAAIEAGDPPDLVRFDLPWTPEFAAAGKLEDLTEKVNAWGEIDDFYPGRLETVILDGKYYGVPSNSNNLALVYNKAMIEAAGITEPPKTWAELKDYAQRLTVLSGGAIDIAGLVIGGRKNETIPFHFLPWLWQAGGDVDQINSPAGVHALENWKSYLTDGIIPEGMLGWGNAELRQQFEAGKAAMMINGPGHVAAVPKNVPDLEFGIWLLPCEANCASVIGGEDWVIPMGARGQEAAWEVLKYYSSPDIHEWWCTNTNTLPSRISVGSAAVFNSDPNLKVFVEQNEVARPRPVHPGYAEISEIIQVAIQSALTNQLSPQAALDQAQASISEILK